MAGDWIKWEKGFAEKDEVAATAVILKLDLANAAVLWMRFFEWADSRTADGYVRGATQGSLDMVMRQSGFAAAGVACGWLKFDDSGLQISNFDRHNGKTAKARALAIERKRRLRRAP